MPSEIVRCMEQQGASRRKIQRRRLALAKSKPLLLVAASQAIHLGLGYDPNASVTKRYFEWQTRHDLEQVSGAEVANGWWVN